MKHQPQPQVDQIKAAQQRTASVSTAVVRTLTLRCLQHCEYPCQANAHGAGVIASQEDRERRVRCHHTGEVDLFEGYGCDADGAEIALWGTRPRHLNRHYTFTQRMLQTTGTADTHADTYSCTRRCHMHSQRHSLAHANTLASWRTLVTEAKRPGIPFTAECIVRARSPFKNTLQLVGASA